MGYDHAPEGHGEYIYENARVPADNVIWGEGRAFDIAQGRLGPGRIHHCMRLIGQAERAYELALLRSIDERKKPRGKLIGQFDSNIERIAEMRMQIDSMRLIVMNAADTMDIRGNKAGRYVIAQSKIMVPVTLANIIDECMQMYGGQGLTQHTVLPELWTYARFVRIADGPDAAHRHQVGRDQLKAAQRDNLIGKYRGLQGAEQRIEEAVEDRGFGGGVRVGIYTSSWIEAVNVDIIAVHYSFRMSPRRQPPQPYTTINRDVLPINVICSR